MPLVNRSFGQLSDLVIHEDDPSVGKARQCVFVDTSSDTVMTPGTVAFRAKGATANAAYAPLSASGQLVVTNEFVVLFGDRYGYKDSWTILAADTDTQPVTGNAVGYVGDNVILSDHLLKEIYVVGSVLNAAQFETLRHLLKAQGVIVERAF